MTAMSLQVDNSGNLFAAAIGKNGIYELPAGSNTWIPVGTNSPAIGSEANMQFDNNGNLFVAPGNDASSFVWELPKGSANWKIAGSNFPQSAWPIDLQFDKAGNLFVGGAEMGVMELPAGSTTWIQTQNIYGAVTAMTSDKNGNLFAGTNFEGGIYELPAGNTEWTSMPGLPTNEWASALGVDSKGNLFAGTFQGAVYELPAGSNNWTQVGNNNPFNQNNITGLQFSPFTDGMIAVSGNFS